MDSALAKVDVATALFRPRVISTCRGGRFGLLGGADTALVPGDRAPPLCMSFN